MDEPKVLVCGAKGYLGSAFLASCPAWIASTVDISDRARIAADLDAHKPDVVINCAGKTGRPNIDWCESHKLETLRANVTGPAILLEECMKRNTRLVHVGSGCIFAGDNGGQGFGEDDAPNFLGSYYSRTKSAADQLLAEFPVLILRLRMPFDDSESPRSLLSKLRSYRRVLDAQNSLTYLPDFIEATKYLIQKRATGIYHIVNPGTVSPYEMMVRYREIVDRTHEFDRLDVAQISEVTQTGRSNCILSTEKLRAKGLKVRPVDEALNTALEALKALTGSQDGRD